MRSRILPAVGVSAIAVLAATAFAGSANASSNHVASSHVGAASHAVHHMKKGGCYSLTTDDSGVGIVSQNFTDAGFDQYDAAGAADFKVKKKGCTVTTISTTGVYFNGAGPADSVNVTIYKNKKNAPGHAIVKQKNKKYTDSTGLGSLVVKAKKTTLKQGTYWISVVANMAFASGGEWGWELSTDTVRSMDMWENPGGGLGTPCTTWGTTSTCLGYSSDFMVSF